MYWDVLRNVCLSVFCLVALSCNAQSNQSKTPQVAAYKDLNAIVTPTIFSGADQIFEILELVGDRRVAILANQTSILTNGTHLVDTLLSHGVHIAKIFTPEHGFRGSADAGAKVKDGKDVATGLSIISLYGNNKKPKAEQLQDVDIVIYDLQDVGVRFYTYISSLEYLMEACAENKKELLILDRPNPLGGKVDGPVLDKKFKSFVGMQPIPVVYGMTPAEYARMLVGEKWVDAPGLKLHVIENQNYTHGSYYALPVSPSPNLKSMTAVYLYPSLCFFEGTKISLGRGTPTPFQIYGHPDLKQIGSYKFTPVSMEGATNPPLRGQLCYGEQVADNVSEANAAIGDGINLKWLLKAYHAFPDKNGFFLKNNFINLLAGTDALKQQIIAGKSAEEIEESWQADLDAFKEIRKKYLLYP